MSRRIVVDASVARSAGGTAHPTSVRSRRFLEEMRSTRHRLVMTDEISREWRKHQSLFATRWLAVMQSRGKVVTVLPRGRAGLLELVHSSELEPNQRAAVEKDCLLVTAAWAADELVASNDNKIRQMMRRLAAGSAELARVVWVNPTVPEEEPVEWLRSGARSSPERTLGHVPRRRHDTRDTRDTRGTSRT